ncbi:hypothetical protein [Marinactinospora rubrisoli]|uniref:ATP/GTP-binding protein n=1 Tax=Marinactinospora rubrisoli TaxID=2715399 RepID=A0ABW2KC82_9ACTN
MLRRTSATAVAVTTIVVISAAPAHAQPSSSSSFLGQIECGTNGGNGCTVSIQGVEEREGSAGTPATGGQESGGQAAGGSEWDHVDWDAVDWDAVDWDAVDWDAIDWDSIDYSGGQPEEGQPPVNPERLIQEAMGSFEVPSPEIATSPGAGSPVLVRTPLWLWLDPESWEPATATAEIPGWSLSLTATPTQVKWIMGDGTELVCDGPGTPFDPQRHDPESESPDCGHVYERSSVGEPGETFTVRAEISWGIDWDSSDGGGGEMAPITTSSEIDLRVQESQSLVTDTGRN